MAQNVVSLVNVHVNVRKMCVLLCGSRPEVSVIASGLMVVLSSLKRHHNQRLNREQKELGK